MGRPWKDHPLLLWPSMSNFDLQQGVRAPPKPGVVTEYQCQFHQGDSLEKGRKCCTCSCRRPAGTLYIDCRSTGFYLEDTDIKSNLPWP
mmetsp:Transcript_9735/g.21385  ORF Transcript_9735/g.21385 Transcript_9735/m.21385 type:complete len:89 (+) Transcript_9735:34-300(+)